MYRLPLYLTDYPNLDTVFPFHIKIEVLAEITAHRHDFLEFIFVLEGNGVEVINGVVHNMSPGTLIFLLPYQFHSIQCEPGKQLKMVICNFNLEMLHDSNEREGGLASIVLEEADHIPPFVQLNKREIERMNSIFSDMMKEFESDERMRSIFIKAKLFEALVLFDRLRRQQHASLQEAPNGSRVSNANVWKALQYLHRHYRDDITLEHLAQQFHYNSSHLSELFKQRFGQNFIHILHGLRIRHACGLLATTELSVTDIAYEAGFGSVQTFSRIFIKLKGISPTAFRKNCKDGNFAGL